MQVLSEPDAAAHFDRILAREVPGGRGLKAWDALLRAHATLMRRLETDLESKTGLALADFDVLAQLAIAGGSLRMTELADRALISRSGMTRRVTRLVHEGLVRRAHADSDARCRGPVDKVRIGPSDRCSSGPCARGFRSIPHEAGRPRARRSRERPRQCHP